MLYFPRQDISSLEITGLWENISTKETWNNRTDLQVLLLEQKSPWPGFWRMGDFLHSPLQLQDIAFQSHMVTSRPRGWKNESRKEMKALLRWAPETGRKQWDIPSPAHPWHQCAAPSVRDQRQSFIFWHTRIDTSLLPERHELSRQLNKWKQKR